MLNLGGVTPPASAMSGAAAAAAGKAGDGDAGDGLFGEMLNKLATDAVAPPESQVPSKASVSKRLSALVPVASFPEVTGLPPVIGPVAADVGTSSVSDVASDETTDTVRLPDSDAPVEHDVAAAAGTTEADNILAAIVTNVTLPTIPQDPQPIVFKGDVPLVSSRGDVPLVSSKEDASAMTSKNGAVPMAAHGSMAAGQADPSDLSALPDQAAEQADEHAATRAGKPDVHAGKRSAPPSPVRQGPVALPPPAAAAHAVDEVGGPETNGGKSPAATGVLAKEAATEAAAAVAAAQESGVGELRPVGDAKRERPADRRAQQSKSLAGEAAVTAQAPGAATAATVSAIGDAKADARQHGDPPSGTRSAPPVSASSASSFETDVRLTTAGQTLALGVRTAEAAAVTTASPEAETIDREVPRQIVQAIRTQWSQGVGSARVTLQPDYLGNLSFDIRVDHGVVTAVLDASNATVRQWIEGHESLLRQSLADQGLMLDRLVVNDEQPQAPMAKDEGQRREQEQPQRRRRPPTPTDATFEVVM